MAKSNLIDISWKSSRSPFVGVLANRDTGVKDQRYVNVFVDRLENVDSGDARFYIVKRPGLSEHSRPSSADGVGRGIFTWNGNLYAVIGNKIYKNSSLLSATLNTSTGTVSFSETTAIASTRYLAINDGTALYLVKTDDTITTIQSGQVQTITVTAGGSGYSSAPTVSFTGGGGTGVAATAVVNAGAVTAITITNRGSGYTSLPTVSFSGGGGTGAAATADLTGLPAAMLPQIEFLNGYMIVATASGRIHNSALEDPTTWQDSDYIQAQSFPDDLVALTRQNDMIMALGTKSVEFFVDVAGTSPGSFMGRLDQGTLQIGCASTFSVVSPENNIFWVSSSDTGGYTVQRLDGIANIEKISSEVLERFLNAEETNIEDCYAYPMRTAGHYFYVLTLPSINRTFVYDIEEKRWTEWSSGSTGRFKYVYCAQYLGTAYLQHESNGRIYKVSPQVYRDGSSDIVVTLQTAPVDYDTQARKFYRSFEVFGDMDDDYSTFTLEYSGDNYRTWSTPREFTNQFRMLVQQLGQDRRRAWRIKHQNNRPMRLEGFEIMYQEGSY